MSILLLSYNVVIYIVIDTQHTNIDYYIFIFFIYIYIHIYIYILPYHSFNKHLLSMNYVPAALI